MKKYVKATEFVFPPEEHDEIKFLINIETITGFANLDMILTTPEFNKIGGVVFGRVDMTGSMGMNREEINNEKILDIAKVISVKMQKANKDMVVGGGVSAHSLPFFKEMPYISRYETRKIIFDAQKTLSHKNPENGILKAVGFELMWLKNKREFYGMIIKEDEERLKLLASRYKVLIAEAGGKYE